MKRILIAYDGSPGAEAALLDAPNCGFVNDVEVRVMAVADVWVPPGPDTSEASFPNEIAAARGEARREAEEALALAQSTAAEGARKLGAKTAGWRISPLARSDSPAWAIIAEGRRWPADLIVVGSHGRSLLERFFLGSISSKVAAEASCSVRIHRSRKGNRTGPPSLLVALDGSEDGTKAAEEVAGREWPAGTEVELLTVIDQKVKIKALSGNAGSALTPRAWAERMLRPHEEALKRAGLKVQSHILEGDSKRTILQEAESREASCVFLGARGLEHGNRLYLGTLASAIATRAPCPVEIVRRHGLANEL